MKRLILLLTITAGIAVILSSCEKGPAEKRGPENPKPNDLSYIHLVVQNYCGGELVSDLLAGKNTKVGVVRVTTDGEFLTVKYEMDVTDWVISETHLSVTASLADIPATMNLNPKTGLFKYKSKHSPQVSAFTYTGIPTEGNSSLYIMAHAVVERVTGWKTHLPAVSVQLPEYVTISVGYPQSGDESYFTTTVTNGGILDGTYSGWCVDVGNAIYPGTEYTAKVVSSYDTDLLGVVDKPENLEKVNWIINQSFTGQTSSDGTVYTFGDVQRAIWELVDNDVSESGLGEWSQERVDEILTLAENAGDSYVPECGQEVVVLLVPVDGEGGEPIPVQKTITQVAVITFPGVCVPVTKGSETAWAAGYDFGGPNWAKYFIYCAKPIR
ncbi:MAG: thioester domain-containing protein [Bacteroidales bacterium]